MASVGQIVAPFTLTDQRGEPCSLEQLLAKEWLLLYFYPADFTPLCTAQACMSRDHHAELAEAGVTLAGISRQNQDSKRRFASEHKLPFQLLADPDGSVQRAFGVLALGGFVTRRVTFLITRDSAGRAVIADRHESNFSLTGHTRFVERVLDRVRRSRPINPVGS